MKRTLATTTFALSCLAFVGCKGGAGDAVKLVPDAATVIGGVNIADSVKSPLYTKQQEKMDAQSKEFMDAAKACNLGEETWKTVTFGADPMKMNDGAFVAVVNVTGLGKKENLECVKGKIKEKTGGEKEPFTLEEKDGKLVITMEDGDAKGWATDANTLVFAGKAWEASVSELIGGKGKAAVDGSLKAVYGRADTGKTIWAAGTIPADMTKGSPADGASDAVFSMDLKDGLALAVSVNFGAAETATTKAGEFNGQWEGVKGMAGGFGVPQPILDSVKIEAKGNNVDATATATKADLDKVAELVGSKMPGGM